MAKWIKIETHTPDKAEMRHIARICRCSKADAFLAFFRVFVWLDEQTEDGHVAYFTAAVLLVLTLGMFVAVRPGAVVNA